MTKHRRKPANAKPISSNPLFPAVVALWFGALFGLGSLAVRPSLLEGLVLKSHIDLIVPAAAPPLGITARILLALIMAALGAILGIMLARRLARPKVENHERKRGAKDLPAAQPRVRSRDAHPDAPARRPISAHEELGSERSLGDERAAASAPGALANRRRALAILDHGPTLIPPEMAPLPGPVQMLDLASLALPADPAPEPALSPPQDTVSAATTLNWASAPSTAPAPEPEPISPEAAHRDGRQVFGMAPPETSATVERQIFGVVASGDHLSQDFVKAAGFQTSVFDTPEPSPLFERLGSEPSAAPISAPSAPEPASAQPLPSPSTLGMTDLAARLAESMRRRRERAQAQPLPTLAETAAVAVQETMAEQPAPIPVLAQFTAVAPAASEPAAANPLAMPAAMRPLALDAFLEHDSTFDAASLMPPRHIAIPAPVSAPTLVVPPVAEQPAAAEDDPEAADENSLADADQDNPYASLLAVAPARLGFVRIDEPAADVRDEIEPVVIFPGQAAPAAPLSVTQNGGSDDGEFRRFDAPASAGQGQPVAAGNAVAAINPAEAAQALRAALSNLQRMSGAA